MWFEMLVTLGGFTVIRGAAYVAATLLWPFLLPAIWPNGFLCFVFSQYSCQITLYVIPERQPIAQISAATSNPLGFIDIIVLFKILNFTDVQLSVMSILSLVHRKVTAFRQSVYVYFSCSPMLYFTFLSIISIY